MTELKSKGALVNLYHALQKVKYLRNAKSTFVTRSVCAHELFPATKGPGTHLGLLGGLHCICNGGSIRWELFSSFEIVRSLVFLVFLVVVYLYSG